MWSLGAGMAGCRLEWSRWAAYVEAPPELDRRLKQTGIVVNLVSKAQSCRRACCLANAWFHVMATCGVGTGSRRPPRPSRPPHSGSLNAIASHRLNWTKLRRGPSTDGCAREVAREAADALNEAQAEEQRLRKLWREAQSYDGANARSADCD